MTVLEKILIFLLIICTSSYSMIVRYSQIIKHEQKTGIRFISFIAVGAHGETISVTHYVDKPPERAYEGYTRTKVFGHCSPCSTLSSKDAQNIYNTLSSSYVGKLPIPKSPPSLKRLGILAVAKSINKKKLTLQTSKEVLPGELYKELQKLCP